MVSANRRVDWIALLRLFTCPGCGNPANQPPLFQCVKGTRSYNVSARPLLDIHNNDVKQSEIRVL